MEMIRSDDLIRAADACADALTPLVRADWSVPAGDLDWTCRRTLGHVVDVLMFYADHIATRSADRLPFKREIDRDRPIEELLFFVRSQASVLARVCDASLGARAYHAAGSADATGFVAMGCDEILVHTNDACAGLGVAFSPDPELCAMVVARLFPWAPDHPDPWERLLWCNGRLALSGHDRLTGDWSWWSRPLDEWDRTAYTSAQPPAQA